MALSRTDQEAKAAGIREVAGIREAAAALLHGFVDALNETDVIYACDVRGDDCRVIATRRMGSDYLCDVCADDATERGARTAQELHDLPYAAALRRLRALLGRA